MKNYEQRLKIQGYTEFDMVRNPDIQLLARWTPFACAVFGTIGILSQNPIYMFGLALLTSIGGLTSRSGYDLLYNMTLRYLLKTEKMPEQRAPRRLGCAIGAAMYALSAWGFWSGNPVLGYVPASVMVVLGGYAAVTHNCFASAIYQWIFGRKTSCC